MEAQILQQDDLAAASLVDCLLNLLADTVLGKGHAGAEQLLQFGNNRLEAVLRVWLAIWPPKMAHEDDGFGTVITCMLDCGERADDALDVCDLLVGVEGDVEVDLEVRC